MAANVNRRKIRETEGTDREMASVLVARRRSPPHCRATSRCSRCGGAGGLIRIFNRDLVSAGMARIEKRGGEDVVPRTDDCGRTIDVHALRHTFGTHLSKAGVPLRTAQAAMRHSDPSLTANVYTDPKLLDMAATVASLPDLPLGAVGVRAAAAN